MPLNNYKVLTIIAALLLISVAPLPYGYYTFVKIVVCAASSLRSYTEYMTHKSGSWMYIWGLIAIIFNPLIPIHMEKDVWMAIDLVAAFLFGFTAWKEYKAATRK